MPKTKHKPKPYSSNQYLLDPRQDECWKSYIIKDSNTYGNAYLSAIKAGYTKNNAKQITSEKWWIEKVRSMNLLSKSERVLDEDLDMQTVVPVIGMFGPIIDKETKQPLKQIDHNLRRVRQNAATFIAGRLGKNKGYSTRSELTGADGKDLPAPIYSGTAK